MSEYRRTLSASSLIGDEVYNPKGEKIGKLEEIMLDVKSGEIAYVVLSFGGFLGIGDKLFALPWRAVTIDEDQERALVNIDKSRLENAPGFDKDDWPDFSSATYRERLEEYYPSI